MPDIYVNKKVLSRIFCTKINNQQDLLFFRVKLYLESTIVTWSQIITMKTDLVADRWGLYAIVLKSNQ